MSTSYTIIYHKASNLINSPKMTKAIEDSPITYYRIMYPFLQGVFGQLVQPFELAEYLQYRKEPEYIIEDFVGNGVERVFPFSFDIDDARLDNIYFNVKLDNIQLLEYEDYEYDEINNSIVFTDAPPSNSNIMVEYYYVGEIVGTSTPEKVSVVLKDYATQLLAKIIVKNWLEKNKNRELAMQANISPKMYQRFSPANAIKENKDLYKLEFDETHLSQQSLGWNKRFLEAKGSSFNLLVDIRPK